LVRELSTLLSIAGMIYAAQAWANWPEAKKRVKVASVNLISEVICSRGNRRFFEKFHSKQAKMEFFADRLPAILRATVDYVKN